MCKQWREVSRLAWTTLKCIRIKCKKLTSDLILNNMITRKHIGHALTRLELNVFSFKDEQLLFTALAQNCPNIEHVKIELTI